MFHRSSTRVPTAGVLSYVDSGVGAYIHSVSEFIKKKSKSASLGMVRSSLGLDGSSVGPTSPTCLVVSSGSRAVLDFSDYVGPPQLFLLVVATLPPACDRCLLASLGLVLVASHGFVISWPLASRGRLVANLGLVLFLVVLLGLSLVLRDVAKKLGSWLPGSQLSETLPFLSCLPGILSFPVPVPNYGNGFLYFLYPSGDAGMVSCIARSCPEFNYFLLLLVFCTFS